MSKQARTPTASGASQAQLEADNYRKPDRFSWNGLQIVIETPKGARRGPTWPRMSCAYGDIKRTEGADGDAVDVFVGPDRSSDLVVVIDQVTPGGRFDEHKVLIGFTTEAAAVKAYRRCYSRGWKVGPVTTMGVTQFKAWLKRGDQRKRIAQQVQHFAAVCCSQPGGVDFYDTQLAFDWEEAKHPRDTQGKFAVGDTLNVPQYGNVEGNWSQIGESQLTIDEPHQHDRMAGRPMVWLKRDDGSKMVRMPAESVRHFADDLNGRVDLPPIGEPSIDAVTSGKAKFLGKGDDGLAFDSGDGNVVKVSTTVPYHPENDAHRTPDEARAMMRKATGANQAMIDAGHGGVLLPQKYIEQGEKGLTVMPKVDTAATYSKEQLDAFAAGMAKLHADGFRIGDTIQTGLAEDGTIRVFDTGKAHAATPKEGVPDFGLEDEQGYIRGLYHDAKVYDHEGEEKKYRQLNKMTGDYLEMSKEGGGGPIGPPSTMRRQHEQYLAMESGGHDAMAYIGADHFPQMAQAEAQGFKMPEGWRDDAARFAKQWEIPADMLLEQNAAAGLTFAEAVDMFGAQMTFNFDETAHPREGSGKPSGGQFATAATAATAKPKRPGPHDGPPADAGQVQKIAGMMDKGANLFAAMRELGIDKREKFKFARAVQELRESLTPAEPQPSEGRKRAQGKQLARDDYAKEGTKAAAFKSWFGDWEKGEGSQVINEEGEPAENDPIGGTTSQVTDEEGQPLEAYHGTGSGSFNAFEKRWGQATGTAGDAGEDLLYGPGIYFTQSEKIAGEYSTISHQEFGGDVDGLKDLAAASLAHMAENLVGLSDYHRAEHKELQTAVGKLHKMTAEQINNPEAADSHTLDAVKKWLPFHRLEGPESLWKDVSDPHVFKSYLNIRNAWDADKGMTPDVIAKLPQAAQNDARDHLEERQNLVDNWDGIIAKRKAENAQNLVDYKAEAAKPESEQDAGLIKYYRQADDAQKDGIRHAQSVQSGYQKQLEAGIPYSLVAATVGGKGKLNEIIAAAGYDGITHTGGKLWGKGTNLHKVWIAFEPNQVKAVDNAGTFDDSDRMKYGATFGAAVDRVYARRQENDFHRASNHAGRGSVGASWVDGHTPAKRRQRQPQRPTQNRAINQCD